MVTFVNCSNFSSNNSSIFAQAVLSSEKTVPLAPGLAGVELMMVQDAAGNVVSFYWNAQESALADGFSPSAIAEYLKHIQRVLAGQTPERFRWIFQLGEQQLLFDVVMSPVMVPN